MQDEQTNYINTSDDPKFSKLEVGDQVIAIRGYALRTDEKNPAPGDRGFVVAHNAVVHSIPEENVSVKFFGFEKVYDFNPKFLQKISNSQPVCADEYSRSTEKARKWLFKRGYQYRGSTTALLLDRSVNNGPYFQLELLLALYQADLDAEFDPTECGPSLKWQIEHLKGCMEVYKEIAEQSRTAPITVLAVDNPSLAEYAKHWEGRTETAEKNLEMMTVIANTTAEKLQGEEAVVGLLKTALETQLQQTETLKKRVTAMEKEAIERNEQLEDSRQDADYQRLQVGKRNDEIDRLQVQLAGCSVAALGGIQAPVVKGSYGWSPSYQDVLNLRDRAEQLTKALQEKGKELDQYVDLGKRQGDEIASLVSELAHSKEVIRKYHGDLFNEMHKGLPACGGVKARGVLYFSPKLSGRAFRNMQRAWNRTCFGELALDWE